MRTSLLSLSVFVAAVGAAAEPVRVVTSLPVYAAIAAEVGGDLVDASAIARGDEDAHYVKPKPSFALRLRDADLFVATGLDLELWVPVLIDKSGNRGIREGAAGYVRASEGVPLLDVPLALDRSAGDVHLYGNPHIFTSPLNAKIVAANIVRGLQRVDPPNAEAYEERLGMFRGRIDREMYGDELPELLGSEVLDRLARQGELIAFLEGRELEGRPLRERLGGWLAAALPMRGRKIVAYHKNWVYFTALFGLEVVGYVEPKPGIPPSARHVHDLIRTMEEEGVGVLLAATYFSRQQVESIARRTGARAVIVPLGPGEEGPPGYVELVDRWLGELLEAFGSLGVAR